MEAKTTEIYGELEDTPPTSTVAKTWDIPKTLKIIYQTIIVKRDEKIYHPYYPRYTVSVT